ncbi:MAG: hypothetical protein ABIA37_03985 [Candidatus Woesearchaeota archaeon]
MMDQTIRIWKIRTSKTELIDITKAWVVLSLAFALVIGSINLLNGNLYNLFSSQFLILFLISLFTAGIGFLFHELGHKFVAQHYGCEAEFRAFDQMLYIALGLAAVIGFIFAAPGAVMIAGRVTLRENGKISMAGPSVNFILAAVFFFLISIVYGGLVKTVIVIGTGLNNLYNLPLLVGAALIGFKINIWLGLFNLIPFGNFDGKKILDWSKSIWVTMVAMGIFLLFFLPKLV